MNIIFNTCRPNNPTIGDSYFDPYRSCVYVYTGSECATAPYGTAGNIQFMPPTDEQLEEYQTLKEAWEEFLVIKKLLGV